MDREFAEFERLRGEKRARDQEVSLEKKDNGQ